MNRKKEHNLLNRKFNYLVVIKESGRDKFGCILWDCQCVCGEMVKYTTATLIGDRAISCGCKRKKHGMYKSNVYTTWQSMKNRCLNKKASEYKYYGGRGIKVCTKWLKFENFYEDMGDRSKNKSLDRINNGGNYCKENCRWATRSEQADNRRSNRLLSWGRQTLTMKQWARELKIPYYVINSRLNNLGWSVGESLTIPYKKKKYKKMAIEHSNGLVVKDFI